MVYDAFLRGHVLAPTKDIVPNNHGVFKSPTLTRDDISMIYTEMVVMDL
jgi:hypothetical protein